MIDAAMARHASRRCKAAFKVRLPLQGRSRTSHNLKLDARCVAEIRAWASREGYGMPPGEQSRRLAACYKVAPGTIVSVLKNDTWTDPAYVPYAPDVDYLRSLSPIGLTLHVLTQRCASEDARGGDGR
jgi:hypothetical protein